MGTAEYITLVDTYGPVVMAVAYAFLWLHVTNTGKGLDKRIDQLANTVNALHIQFGKGIAEHTQIQADHEALEARVTKLERKGRPPRRAQRESLD